jgi:hypothetical protein
MPWGAAIAAGASLIGGAVSSSAQSSAAEQAAADQEQAAIAQLGLSASTLNVQGGLSLPTREAGGLAQSREAYLLGLSPNLDISSDFSTPSISVNPTNGQSTTSWNGPASNDPAITGTGAGFTGAAGTVGAPAAYNASAYGPTGPVSFGGATYGSATPPAYAGIGASSIPGSQAGLASAVAGPGTAAGTAAGAGAATGAGGVPNPNASLPAGSYGSFSSPYNASTFYEDPGYQFILSQGQQQIQNQQATTGLALSPSSLAAALNYNSGMASQEFNNAYSRSMNTQTTQLNELNALSSGGQIATSGLSSAAGAAGTAGASALAGYGNAGAQGSIGVGNAISSGVNGATNAALYGVNSPYGSAAYSAGFGSVSGETPYAQGQANGMLGGTNAMIAGDSDYQALQNPVISD